MLTRPILITQESLKLHNARNDCVKLRTPVTRKFHRSTEDEQRPICVHCLGTKSYSLHYRMLWQILYQRFSTWVSGVSKETGSLCFCLLILSFYGMPSKYFAVELFRQYVYCDWWLWLGKFWSWNITVTVVMDSRVVSLKRDYCYQQALEQTSWPVYW